MKNLKVIRPVAEKVILTCASCEHDRLELERSLSTTGVFFSMQSGTDDDPDCTVVTVLAERAEAVGFTRELAHMLGFDLVERDASDD